MSQLVAVSKAKSKSAGHDTGVGAAAGAAGYAAMSPRHYWIADMTGTGGIGRAGVTVGRGIRGAGIGALGGLAAHQLRRDKKMRKTTTSKAFAARDQNSSPATATTSRGIPGKYKTTTLNARSGHFADKTRNVGRKEGRDQNSSPRVTRVQPRHPNGRWVSHENDLSIVHPERNSGMRRTDRTSSVLRATKGGDKASRPWVSKVDVPLNRLMSAFTPKRVTGTGAGAMRQSARVTSAQTKGVMRNRMPRIPEPGYEAKHAAGQLASTVKGSRAAGLYGRSNTRFGMTPSRGRKMR